LKQPLIYIIFILYSLAPVFFITFGISMVTAGSIGDNLERYIRGVKATGIKQLKLTDMEWQETNP